MHTAGVYNRHSHRLLDLHKMQIKTFNMNTNYTEQQKKRRDFKSST